MKDNSDPAFPTDEENSINNLCHFEGMTLRDWFAGQALSGLSNRIRIEKHPLCDIVKDAYAMANAMLAERDK